MISIKKSQIPQYLKNSEFYKSLEDKGILKIPKRLLKKSTKVKNVIDFDDLLNTVQYFGIEYPKTLYKYYQNNSYDVLDFYDNSIDLPEKIEFFKRLLDLQIKNFEQFESNMRIYELFRMDYSDEFIEHAFNNKRLCLKNKNFRYKKFQDSLLYSEEWRIDFYHREHQFFNVYELKKHYIIDFDLDFSLNYEDNFCDKYIEFVFFKEDYEKFKKYLKSVLKFISENHIRDEEDDLTSEEEFPGIKSIQKREGYDVNYIIFGNPDLDLSQSRDRIYLNDNKKINFECFNFPFTNFNKKIILQDMEKVFNKIISSVENYLKNNV